MSPTFAGPALLTAIPSRYPRQRERVLRILDRWHRTVSHALVVTIPALEAPTRS